MTDRPDDDYDPAIDDAFDLVADNAYDWWCCPCDVHLFYLGVSAALVEGFAPRYTVDAAAKHLAQLIADHECASCNFAGGARLSNQIRRRRRTHLPRRWQPPQADGGPGIGW